MGSGGGSLASNVEQIKLLLQRAELVGVKVPPTIYAQLEGLKSSTSGTEINAMKWDDLKDTPNTMWKDIEPFFKLRDDIAKSIDPQTLLGKFLGSLSASVDKLLYGALSSILGPVIGSFRKQIMEERTILLQKEETMSKDPESDIFGPGSTATNPTHSQVAKDHFDCILNIPAGKGTNMICHCLSQLTTSQRKSQLQLQTSQLVRSSHAGTTQASTLTT
jgi:hypothetical protein